MRCGCQSERREGPALELDVRRILDHLAAIVALSGAHNEFRWLAIRQVCQLLQATTGELSEVMEMRLEMGQQIRLQVQREKQRQIRICGVEVLTQAVRNGITIGRGFVQTHDSPQPSSQMRAEV